MKRFILTLIVLLLLTHAAILGAWLGGAEPGPWAFILASYFSLALALADALVGKS
jgi:hypothetical protein